MERLLRLPASFLRRINLWPRLAVGVTLGHLALFGVLTVLIVRVVDDSRDRILEERLVIAQLTARQIDGVLEHAFDELEAAAASQPLRGSNAGSARLSDELSDVLATMASTWSSLYLLDTEGNVIAGAPLPVGEVAVGPTGEPPFQRTYSGGARGVSSPFMKEPSGDRLVELAVPVNGSQGGAGVVLGGVLDLTRAELGRILDDAKSLGETGHAELVDVQGRVIAATDDADFLAPGEHLEFYVRMHNEGQEGVETVPYESHGVEAGEADRHGDDDHIMAFAQLSHAPWGLAVGGAESETLAPVTDLRTKILLIGAGALAALWLAALVSSRLLVRPVRALTGAADRIAAGDLESPIHVIEGGEIGRLGETLETMRRRLRESLEEISRWGRQLETKVEERTAQLNARNLQLTALTAVATAANESQNLNQMLERCLGIVLEHTGMEAGSVRVLDRARGKLVAASRQGAFADFPCRERLIALDECPCGRVAATAEPMIGHPAEFEGLTRKACLAEGFNFIAVLPLRSPKGVQGVLYLGRRHAQELEQGQREVLTVMSNQIGVAIENARLLQDMSKMEAQREIDRLKSEFMSSVSHELRTPLGFIKGYATTLLREDLSAEPETQKEFLEIIGEESDKLQKLIDDLLDAARLHSGGLALSRTRARLGRVVEQAAEKLRVAFPEQTFRLDLPSQEPEVLIDPWRIEQVVQNLVDNAVRYSTPGKPVGVRVYVEGLEVVVSVRDQGDGITARDVERVFEPFYRGHRAAERSPGGTGLGLTICRGIVEAHRGRIWVESKRGRGSTFFFALPVAEADAGPETVLPETGRAGRTQAMSAHSRHPRPGETDSSGVMTGDR